MDSYKDSKLKNYCKLLLTQSHVLPRKRGDVHTEPRMKRLQCTIYRILKVANFAVVQG